MCGGKFEPAKETTMQQEDFHQGLFLKLFMLVSG